MVAAMDGGWDCGRRLAEVAVVGSLPLLRWESPGRGSPGARSFVHRSLWPVVEHGDLPFWEGAGVEFEGGLPALSVGFGV